MLEKCLFEVSFASYFMTGKSIMFRYPLTRHKLQVLDVQNWSPDGEAASGSSCKTETNRFEKKKKRIKKFLIELNH